MNQTSGKKKQSFLGVKTAGVKLGTWAETEIRGSEPCSLLFFPFPVVSQASCTLPSPPSPPRALVMGTNKSSFYPGPVMEILPFRTIPPVINYVQYNTLVDYTLRCCPLVQNSITSGVKKRASKQSYWKAMQDSIELSRVFFFF